MVRQLGRVRPARGLPLPVLLAAGAAQTAGSAAGSVLRVVVLLFRVCSTKMFVDFGFFSLTVTDPRKEDKVLNKTMSWLHLCIFTDFNYIVCMKMRTEQFALGLYRYLVCLVTC